MQELEIKLIELIEKCTDREKAITLALEVIHAELERLLSEPEFQLSNHPVVGETFE